MDACAQIGLKALKDTTRHLPNPEMLVSPDTYGSVGDVITKFWNSDQSVDDAAKALATAIKG
jgi:glucose/mannose transport system substrate-binding protein